MPMVPSARAGRLLVFSLLALLSLAPPPSRAHASLLLDDESQLGFYNARLSSPYKCVGSKITVSGQVVKEYGAPVKGANVTIRGVRKAVSGDWGGFSFEEVVKEEGDIEIPLTADKPGYTGSDIEWLSYHAKACDYTLSMKYTEVFSLEQGSTIYETSGTMNFSTTLVAQPDGTLVDKKTGAAQLEPYYSMQGYIRIALGVGFDCFPNDPKTHGVMKIQFTAKLTDKGTVDFSFTQDPINLARVQQWSCVRLTPDSAAPDHLFGVARTPLDIFTNLGINQISLPRDNGYKKLRSEYGGVFWANAQMKIEGEITLDGGYYPLTPGKL
jgi:hypothetical protein